MGTTRSNGKCYDMQGGNPDGKEGERIICLDAIFSGERPCRVRSRLVRVVWGLNDVEKIRREMLQLYIRLQYQPDLKLIRTRAQEKNLFYVFVFTLSRETPAAAFTASPNWLEYSVSPQRRAVDTSLPLATCQSSNTGIGSAPMLAKTSGTSANDRCQVYRPFQDRSNVNN